MTDLLLEKVQHGLVNVAAEGVLMHGFWCPDAVHHHIRNVVFSDVRQHILVKQSARDVVDEIGTFGSAGFGHILSESVDGKQGFGKGRFDSLQDGDDALQFLLFRGDGIVGSCGAAADVDEVGTLGKHLFAVLQCLVHLVVAATVGERVGRHIEDAHDGGAVENEGFIAQIELQH